MRQLLALFTCCLIASTSHAMAQDNFDAVIQEITTENPTTDTANESATIPVTTQTNPSVTTGIETPITAGTVIATPQEEAEKTYDGSSPLPTFEATKYAVLQTLDKVTARTHTVTLPIGKPSAVGPIFAEVKTCQKTPPTEQPEAAAFIQVWEAKPKSAQQGTQTESQWVFSGWMFASSPALSAMDHPIYDVWLKDCTNEIASPKAK